MAELERSACPSIVYRIRNEIRGEKLTAEERALFWTKIAETEAVRQVLSWQNEAGFFGTRLHTPLSGSKIWSHEGCVRFLLEAGLDIDFEPLNRALMALLTPEWKMECQNSRAAEILDPGLLRAALFAQAGLYEYGFMEEWVGRCLGLYRLVAEANSFCDLTNMDKHGRHIFRDNKPIPAVYHMRILAYTYGWRTEDNLNMLKKAFENLAEWIPLPPMFCKAGSQLIAPFGSMNVPLMTELEETNGFWWLHYRELMARMGVLDENSTFLEHFVAYDIDELFAALSYTENWFKKSYKKKGYISWSGYGGLALEGSWRKKDQRLRDLAFRFCLIEHLRMQERPQGSQSI